MADPTTLHLERDGGRLAYDDTGGDGPLVLCVPGVGDTRSEYRHLRPLLVAAGHRVVTVDLRGHGASSVGWPSYRPEDVGDDVVALLDALRPERGAVVLGCSLGAAAAVWAAAERPDVVRGLGLLGPFVRDLPTPWYLRLAIPLLTAGAWVRYVGGLFPSGGPDDLAAHLAALRANLGERGRMAALKALLRASKDACEARIPEVTADTVVVMGGADEDFPDPAAEAGHVADVLAGRAVVLDGLGHYPHVASPQAVARHLVELVERACPASA